MRKAAVLGWPVSHSLSPALHGAWIAAAGLDASYEAIAVPPETAEATLRDLAGLGLVGANVTVPHKEVALKVADAATDRARAMGATNLLTVRPDGTLHADNTDALGFLYGLTRAGADAAGPAVVLGAGGAARAVVAALADAACAELRIVNRSADKSRALATLGEGLGLSVSTFAFDAAPRALAGARLVVNATSLGLKGGQPLDLSLDGVAADAVVYDLVYVPLETPLLADARRRGLLAIDGLDMLIGQARPSFEAFFGAPPPADADVRALLESKLAERAA